MSFPLVNRLELPLLRRAANGDSLASREYRGGILAESGTYDRSAYTGSLVALETGNNIADGSRDTNNFTNLGNNSQPAATLTPLITSIIYKVKNGQKSCPAQPNVQCSMDNVQ